jgi:hypothetical protein
MYVHYIDRDFKLAVGEVDIFEVLLFRISASEMNNIDVF